LAKVGDHIFQCTRYKDGSRKRKQWRTEAI